MNGVSTPLADLPDALRADPLALAPPPRRAVPFNFPGLLPGANGQPDTLITASPTPIQVIESGVRLDGTTPRPAASGPATPTAPAPAAEGNGPSPIVWIGLVALLGLAGVLVFGGTIRGWLRRDD